MKNNAEYLVIIWIIMYFFFSFCLRESTNNYFKIFQISKPPYGVFLLVLFFFNHSKVKKAASLAPIWGFGA